jgi:phage terminase large subunit-like protein
MAADVEAMVDALDGMIKGDIPFDEDLFRMIEEHLRPVKVWKCPHYPLPKQEEFLKLECKEALYGGAAGGGKSDALLMWILQGVHIPNYKGLIMRKTFAQLDKASALIPRSHEWLAGTGARWNGQKRVWRFPSGATVEFGSLKDPTSHYDFQSAEYARIAFDELTEHREYQFDFMFSRIRVAADFPLSTGMRGASNPGGEGHLWVKNRFISREAEDALISGEETGTYYKNGAAFVPARVQDNPHIRLEEYISNLSHLKDPILRDRLLKGDWSVKAESVFPPDWFRYYFIDVHRIIPMRPKGDNYDGIRLEDCRIFQTADTAGTSRERERVRRSGIEASSSCIATWAWSEQHKFMFLLNVWRDKVDFIPLCDHFREQYEKYHPESIYIENAHLGPAVKQTLEAEGIPAEFISTYVKRESSDSGKPGKFLRSVPLQKMMKSGRLFLPKYDSEFLHEYESEFMSWEGSEGEQADQIDVSSYAARICDGATSNTNMTPDADIATYLNYKSRSRINRPVFR